MAKEFVKRESGTGSKGTMEKPDVISRKRNLTLDLQMNNKRNKLDVDKNSVPILSSPDIKKLKLKSPELENLIIQQNPLGGATPTPTSQILFPKSVTEAQEDFSKGFVDALNELHCSDSSQGGTTNLDLSSNNSDSSVTYTDLEHQPSRNFSSPLGVVIKEEPQTVPSMLDSPSYSPIDLENQEIIKLERKRQRNRLAASKCRRRKLERIARLEDKVKQLKGENSDLSGFLVKLKDQVSMLKAQVLEHHNSGCQIMSYC